MDELVHLNPPAALPAILGRTEALAFPMPSEPRTGAMLRVLAASKPGGRFLELGTGTGLCTAWLLDGMDLDARLTSVDVEPEVQAVAREFLGGDTRLEIVTADAGEFLQQQKPETYDLIFADAMLGKATSYSMRRWPCCGVAAFTWSTTCCRRKTGRRTTHRGCLASSPSWHRGRACAS